MSGIGEWISPGPTGRVLVDAHAHFHECFNREMFLEGAAANFECEGRRLGLPERTVGILLLAERAGENDFYRLSDPANRRTLSASRWKVAPAGENGALVASRDGEPRFGMMAGRQLTTREGLEVLALCCTRPIEDGLSAEETVKAAEEAGAPAVLPWAFGKWWFRRGGAVRRLIEEMGPARLFLGDNAGRPAISPRPRLLAAARRRGFIVLPGSDPLALPSHVGRAGRYGLILETGPELGRPATELKTALGRLHSQPVVYGRLESLLGFCANQAALRLGKLGIAAC